MARAVNILTVVVSLFSVRSLFIHADHISPQNDDCFRSQNEHSRQGNLDSFFKDYQRLDKINDFLKRLAQSNPSVAEVASIGKTVEGRDMLVLKIVSGGSKKPAIWIDAGIHAREWIAPPVALYIAQQLLDGKNREYIDKFVWYILPVLNPDGYEFSHTTDRYWRKNRRGCGKNSGQCCGVDLNRNFGFHWSAEGASSDNPCDEMYHGPSAFSEPETLNLANYILNQNRSQPFVALLTFHSYGQFWFPPYGWTKDNVPDYDDLVAVAQKGAAAIQSVNGVKYKVLPSSHELGPAPGGEDDWGYGGARIKYSYTIELPDTGEHAFKLPKERIPSVVQEIWEGVKAFTRALVEQELITQ